MRPTDEKGKSQKNLIGKGDDEEDLSRSNNGVESGRHFLNIERKATGGNLSYTSRSRATAVRNNTSEIFPSHHESTALILNQRSFLKQNESVASPRFIGKEFCEDEPDEEELSSEQNDAQRKEAKKGINPNETHLEQMEEEQNKELDNGEKLSPALLKKQQQKTNIFGSSSNSVQSPNKSQEASVSENINFESTALQKSNEQGRKSPEKSPTGSRSKKKSDFENKSAVFFKDSESFMEYEFEEGSQESHSDPQVEERSSWRHQEQSLKERINTFIGEVLDRSLALVKTLQRGLEG